MSSAILSPRLTVYTDGASLPNPGPGGWSWITEDGRHDAGGDPRITTNNRMELRAVMEALLALDGPLEIVSDSKYVTDAFNADWISGWQRRQWHGVKNAHQWQALLYALSARDVTFTWVKGHNGDPLNEAADRLANEAASAAADVAAHRVA